MPVGSTVFGHREKRYTQFIMKRTQLVRRVLGNFAGELRKTYRQNYSRLVVFGSEARGKARPDSDVDVLVVLKNEKDHWSEFNRVIRLAYEVTFGQGIPVVLSAFVSTEKQYRKGGSPFLTSIKKEGIAVH